MARLTSAVFGHTVGYSVGLAYLPTGSQSAGQDFEVELLGSHLRARMLEALPVDPAGDRLRA